MVGALWGVAARTCSILLATFLCNCCIHIFSHTKDGNFYFNNLVSRFFCIK